MIVGVWVYAWVRLSPEQVPALGDDVAALGTAEVSSPQGTTTVLAVLTASADPTAELVAPPVLLQYGGPRDHPVALALPPQLSVTVDGEGEVPLELAQRQGGTDLLVRAITDYTQVRIDHVVSVSVDALPRLLAVVEPGDGCPTQVGGCGHPGAEELRGAVDEASTQALIGRVQELVRALAEEIDRGWVLRSPLAAKRSIDLIDAAVRTDVSLRGSRLLDLTASVRRAGELELITLPGTTHPENGRHVVLEEPAAVRFQQLREGTSLAAGESDTDTSALVDVSVAVLNGAGIDGLAADVQASLEAQGFRVLGTGNATSFDRRRTVVHYVSGDQQIEAAATLLAEGLDGAALEPLEQRPTFEGQEVDLLVTAGEDLTQP